jgi:hypothetical protein
MPDTLTTVTNLINSPPGQLVAGGVLAGIVWKFFERVESVLNDDTKLEIAVWLLGRQQKQQLAKLLSASQRWVMDERPLENMPVSKLFIVAALLSITICLLLAIYGLVISGDLRFANARIHVPSIVYGAAVYTSVLSGTLLVRYVPLRYRSVAYRFFDTVMFAVPVVFAAVLFPIKMFGFLPSMKAAIISSASGALCVLIVVFVPRVIIKAARRFDIGCEFPASVRDCG